MKFFTIRLSVSSVVDGTSCFFWWYSIQKKCTLAKVTKKERYLIKKKNQIEVMYKNYALNINNF